MSSRIVTRNRTATTETTTMIIIVCVGEFFAYVPGVAVAVETATTAKVSK